MWGGFPSGTSWSAECAAIAFMYIHVHVAICTACLTWLSGLLSIKSCQATHIKWQWVCLPGLLHLVTNLPTIFRVKDMAEGLSCITTVKNRTTELELSLLRTLACNIKQKLVLSRKEEPLVQIRLPFDAFAFKVLKQKRKSLKQPYSHSTCTIRQYSDLNELLGDRWYIRIVNSNGDFSQVLLETIWFYLTRPKPILDYDVEQDEVGSSLFRTGSFISFQFCS